jgi:hypothetical protein
MSAMKVPPFVRSVLRRRWAVVLITLLGLEILSRLLLGWRDSRNEERQIALYPPNAYIRDYWTKLDYRYISLFTLDPKTATQPEYAIDDYGFRMDKRRLAFAAPTRHKAIWMIGGSTTMGLGVLEAESIPSHLNDLLEKNGSEYRAYNMGQLGFDAGMELLLFLELIEGGHKPDLIVVYDGTNEDPFPGDEQKNGRPGWERGTLKTKIVRNVQDGQSWGASLALAITRMTKIDDAMRALLEKMGIGRPRGLATKPGEHNVHPDGNWDVVERRHLVSLTSIAAIADGMKVPVRFFLSPTMEYDVHFGFHKLSEYEDKKLGPLMNGDEHLRHDALMADALREMRGRLDGRLFDIYDVFRGHDGETLYVDPRHPNGAGNAVIAARIYKELEPLVTAVNGGGNPRTLRP